MLFRGSCQLNLIRVPAWMEVINIKTVGCHGQGYQLCSSDKLPLPAKLLWLLTAYHALFGLEQPQVVCFTSSKWLTSVTHSDSSNQGSQPMRSSWFTNSVWLGRAPVQENLSIQDSTEAYAQVFSWIRVFCASIAAEQLTELQTKSVSYYTLHQRMNI